MRVGVFHPGSQNAWQRAAAFREAGALAWHATSVYAHPDDRLVRLAGSLPDPLGARLRRDLLRRHFPLLDPADIRRMGAAEIVELLLRRLGAMRLAHHVNVAGNRGFGAAVIRHLQREPVDVVWGYNNSSVEVFRWAKARGFTCVLDQSIGHPAAENATLLAEQARHPEFFARAYRPHGRRWIAQQDEELDLADLIVCGSRASADTVIAAGCDPAKVRIVPYGYDETAFPAAPPRRPPVLGRPLKMLFAGTIGPRKGVAYLLQAIARLPREVAELTLVGRLDIPARTFARYADRARHVPQVARGEVVKHFLAADVFVFPSLFEGGALVLAEAQAAGLGIVQGPASGVGAEDGVTGRVLARPDAEALADTIAALHAEPARLAGWQAAAAARAPGRRWAVYRRRVRELFAV